MAPSIMEELGKRQFTRLDCPSGYVVSNNRCVEYSAWYWWGRWVLAGIVVVAFVVFLVLLGCINSRRRRKRGMQPMYGTGWMANPNKFGGPGNGTYAHNGTYDNNPPPAYNAPPPQQNAQYTGSTFNPNDGYYAGQNQGIQLQQPAHSYQRDVYSPPAGPPPGK